jgi:hypothetical protein
MKLFKTSDESALFQLHGLTDDQLIAMYNICLNYKNYLEQIKRMPDSQLLSVAPNKNVETARNNLKMQSDFCDSYVEMFKETIKKGSPHKN